MNAKIPKTTEMKLIKLIVTLLNVLLFGFASANAQYPSGLVGLWNGDGNLVDSVGGNNGSVSSLVQLVDYVPGVKGNAFKFNAGTVSVPDDATLDTASVTVQAWVKSTPPGAYSYIIQKARGAGGISYAFYTGGDGTLYFFVGLAGGGGTVLSPSGGTNVWDNNWHQITGVYDGTAVHLFVDGVEVGSGTVTGVPNGIDYSSPQPLIFGNYILGGLPYAGTLDEVKIFNVAQSASDVGDAFTNSASSALTNGLVSWYKAEANAQDSWGANDGIAPPQRIFTYGNGRTGQAFFPQNGNGAIPDAPALDPANVTLQAWVKSVSPSYYAYIACKSEGDAGVSYALTVGGGGGVEFLVTLAQGGGSVISPIAAPAAVWDGAWHLVTGVWDGLAAHVYLDGIEQGSGTTSPNAANGIEYTNAQSLVIGDYRAPGGLPFIGLIDDLQLYNRALTSGEILGYYSGGTLVSWWSANTNANDSIGTNTGSLVGTASYGASRSFVGNSFNTSGGLVKISQSSSIEVNNITVEAQVDGSSPGTNKYIIAKSYSGALASYGLFTGPNGGLEFYVNINGVGRVTSPDAGTNVWDGKFHLVDGTYDGSHVHLYVDGNEIGSGTAASGTIVYGTGINGGELLFGDFYDSGSSSNFVGLIDEVKIYNAALSSAQLANAAFHTVFIVTQPQTQYFYAGSKAEFSVIAQGNPPLSYQWLLNGTNIPGATKQILALTNVQPSQLSNSYSVIVSGSSMHFTIGFVGSAFSCNQGSLVRVSDTPAFETQNFSIQLYARAVNPGTYQYLLSKRGTNIYGTSYAFYTGASGGLTWFVNLLPPGGSATPATVGASIDSSVWDGNWHQITGEWDGEFVNLYVDGQLKSSVDSFGGAIGYGQDGLNGDVLIGDYSSPPSGFGFTGGIDEVKFFDHALNDNDVLNSYTNLNDFGSTNGLVSWYQAEGNALDSWEHNNGMFVPIAGYEISANGLFVLPPAQFVNPLMTPSGFQSSLQGPTGNHYVVQYSSDLITWVPFVTNTIPFSFTNSNVPVNQKRFYRAVQQP